MIKLTIDVDGKTYHREVFDSSAATFWVEQQLIKHYHEKDMREQDCSACYYDGLSERGHPVHALKLYARHSCGEES